MFKEVNVNELDNIDKSKFENYFIEDELKHDRLFRLDNYYVGLTEVEGIAFLDIICTEGKGNILTECFKLTKQLFEEYKFLGFSFPQGWKSEILVNRIIKNYTTVHESLEGNTKIIIFKEVVNEQDNKSCKKYS